MFAGLASPSHLIIVLVVVLLLFGDKRDASSVGAAGMPTAGASSRDH
jgi:Sec-independent protein translocase protein TatA